MEGPILDRQSCKTPSASVVMAPRPSSVNSDLPALLVGSETNQHPFDRQSHAQECIHHAVEKFRFLIADALWTSPNAEHQKRASKMGLCCVAPQIFADADSSPVCVAGYCRDRLCPTCMRRRASKVRSRLCGLVASMNAPRFLTLGERDNDDPLKSRMDRITAALRRFRRTDTWKRHVRGGVMVWEVTRNVEKGTWHPHVHLIIDGEFWPFEQLYAAWNACLGHTGSAKIEACHDRHRSARYLAKYLAKDAEVAFWPRETIREFADGMHRRRLIATFGSCHKVNVDLCDEEKEKPKLPRASISYGQLREAIDSGLEPARKAAPLLARMGIAFRQLFFEFSVPGDVYADQIPASQMADFGRWIEETCALLMHDGTPESTPPPVEFEGQKDLWCG